LSILQREIRYENDDSLWRKTEETTVAAVTNSKIPPLCVEKFALQIHEKLNHEPRKTEVRLHLSRNFYESVKKKLLKAMRNGKFGEKCRRSHTNNLRKVLKIQPNFRFDQNSLTHKDNLHHENCTENADVRPENHKRDLPKAQHRTGKNCVHPRRSHPVNASKRF
jgi:DNA mismatch repair ATPase MutL